MPKIFFLDFEIRYSLKIKYLDATLSEGSLGYFYRDINEGGYSSYNRQITKLSPIIDIPQHIHESEIIVIDLFGLKQYKTHFRKRFKNSINNYYYELPYGSTADTRCIGSKLLSMHLSNYTGKQRVIIVFSNDESILTTYEDKVYSLYDFDSNSCNLRSSHGQEIYPINNKKYQGISNVINKHQSTFSYRIDFYDFDDHFERINNAFLKNYNNEIVSYINDIGNDYFIYLPNSTNKEELIIDLVTEGIPEDIPDIVPEFGKNKWLEKESYYLREELELRQDAAKIKQEAIKKIKKIKTSISNLRDEKSYIYEILFSSDKELVTAVLKFFKWLEFDEVINVDIEKEKEDKVVFEEDIRVKLKEGILVIECKGISGTSKDYECSQVYKFKTRLQEERGKFDVSALYIVNHQRHKEPLDRENPPFTEKQIQDAKNDKRGLVTTWQLFQMHNSIIEGIFSKKEAREMLLEYGLVPSIPKTWKLVGSVENYLSEKKVIYFRNNDYEIVVGDELLIFNEKNFYRINVESIMLNNDALKATHKDRELYGMKVNKDVPVNVSLWIR